MDMNMNNLLDLLTRIDSYTPPAEYIAETVTVENRSGLKDKIMVSKPLPAEPFAPLVSFAALRLNMETADIPTIRVISDMEIRRYIGHKFAGLFFPQNMEIWLAQDTVENSTQAWRDSVVVHETVHYIQRKQGRMHDFDTPTDNIHFEIEAYTIQRDWLRENHPDYHIWLTDFSDYELVAHIHKLYGPTSNLFSCKTLNTKPSDILKAGLALIRDKAHWTQHAAARNKYRKTVDATNPDACSWCSYGALLKTTNDTDASMYDIESYLYQAVAYTGSYIFFNDTRSHADVVAMWEKAIRLAEADEVRRTVPFVPFDTEPRD